MKTTLECDSCVLLRETHALLLLECGRYQTERESALASVEAWKARAERAEKERDAQQEEILLLRTCVSTHFHGSAQDKANAYGALRNFDKRRMAGAARPAEPGGGE